MNDDNFAVVIGFMVIGLIVLIFGIVLVVNRTTHHYDKINCHRFAVNTNRETKFVDYTFWRWDCLTPSGDGKWIPTDQLRDIN